jgi:hypothetical protein
MQSIPLQESWPYPQILYDLEKNLLGINALAYLGLEHTLIMGQSKLSKCVSIWAYPQLLDYPKNVRNTL